MTIGQLNYEGYCKESGNKSLISGAPLPPWQDLDPKIKAAWEAGAQGVVHRVVEFLETMHTEMDKAQKAIAEAADALEGL